MCTNFFFRFVTPYVLFPRLQRQTITGASGGILRNADQPSRHMPFKLVACRKKRRMRATESNRNAESLSGSDTDVSPELAGWNEKGQTEKIGSHDDQRVMVM